MVSRYRQGQADLDHGFQHSFTVGAASSRDTAETKIKAQGSKPLQEKITINL